MGAVCYVNQQESVSGIKKGHPGEWSSAGVRLVVHILAAVTFLHQSCAHSDLYHLEHNPLKFRELLQRISTWKRFCLCHKHKRVLNIDMLLLCLSRWWGGT